MEEKWIEAGKSILSVSRKELYMKMRFLDVALSSFEFVPDSEIDMAGTEGFYMFYNPCSLGNLYKQDRILVNRLYLHMVLHCIFRHLTRRKKRDKLYWDLACDITIESMIDSMMHRCVRRSRSWLRRETYKKLHDRIKVFTAEKIYGVLTGAELTQRNLEKLIREFTVDDHRFWPEDEDDKKKNEIENKWKNQSEKMETDMETFSKEASDNSGTLLDNIKVENKSRFNYQDFLRKFSVLKEEVMIDDDSFDYNFYSYGLRLYGNMPLIEPQESKEVQKIEDFVIVIDTSMSCKGELVKKFLEETYSVLSEKNSFFHKVNIHMIQCDDEVREDKVVTSKEELKEYMENLTLCGEGGTDFRPAFEYVDDLIRKHEFGSLKGLLYFTDGKGIYPSRMPSYETAFVFFKEDYEDVDVPPWAMKLILEEEENLS